MTESPSDADRVVLLAPDEWNEVLEASGVVTTRAANVREVMDLVLDQSKKWDRVMLDDSQAENPFALVAVIAQALSQDIEVTVSVAQAQEGGNNHLDDVFNGLESVLGDISPLADEGHFMIVYRAEMLESLRAQYPSRQLS